MSYIPTNPYYAWVYLKIGLFEATPIPPEHLISMELQRGPGGTSIKSPEEAVKDAQNWKNDSNIKKDMTSLCTSVKIVLFDETALRVEAQIILGQDVVQFCYGYVNGPRSMLYNLYIHKFTTNFSRAGSATLTLELVPNAMLSFKLFNYIDYKGMTLNEIVEAVRKENGWGGGLEAGTVAEIRDVKETVWEKDAEDPDKYHEVTRPKIFIRMNQNPIDFLQYEIAPYCETPGGYGDFKLWFDSPASPYDNSIKGSPLGDIANSVSDFFKGFLTNLTDPIMKEINKALGEVLSWVSTSLAKVNELVGKLGKQVSDAMSKLSEALGGLQGVAKQAISALASGGLSGLTQNLTSSLVSAGMNIVQGALGGILDKVTGNLTGQISSLLGGVLGNLSGGLGGSLTKLNSLTNLSMLNLDDLNKFKNAGKFANAMKKGLSGSGSVMYFRPIIMEIDNQKTGVGLDYFFDVGSTGGAEGESSVLDFNYTEPSGGILQTPRDILLAAINIEDGGLALSEEETASLLEARTSEGARKLHEGRLCLAISSDSPAGLEKLSATLFSIYRRQKATRISMKVFGDPSLRVFEKCQVTVMTKTGQVHYSSGYYFINKITDNIQGGVFTTSIEAFRHPEDNQQEYQAPSIQGGAVGGVFEYSSIDNSGDAQINESKSDANDNVTDRTDDITNQWEEDIWGNKILGQEDIDEYLKEDSE